MTTDPKPPGFIKRNIKRLVYVLILFGFGYLLWYFRSALSVLFIVPYVVYKLQSFGINEYLAWATAAPVGALLIVMYRLLRSGDPEKKNYGYAMMAIMGVSWCLILFFITKDVNYDMYTSEATKCYARGIDGKYDEMPCDALVHPQTKDPVVKGNRQIIATNYVRDHGYPVIERVPVDSRLKDIPFYTPFGDPLMWYYMWDDGKIELFTHPGNHPQLPLPLQPITPEVVHLLFKQIDANRRDKVVFHDKIEENSEQQSFHNPNGLRALKDLKGTLESTIKD